MLNQNDQEPIIIQRGSETAPGLRSRRKESLVPSCHWVALKPLDFATLAFFSFVVALGTFCPSFCLPDGVGR